MLHQVPDLQVGNHMQKEKNSQVVIGSLSLPKVVLNLYKESLNRIVLSLWNILAMESQSHLIVDATYLHRRYIALLWKYELDKACEGHVNENDDLPRPKDRSRQSDKDKLNVLS